MSDAGTNAVKIGVWTDYSKPRPLGATLTLPNRTAALLLAFLATLVGVTATRSWRPARFLLFHLFAFEKGSAETQPNPTQVLLRNSETAAGAGVNIAFLLLPWNAKPTPPTKITRKRAAIVLASLCHWILFIAAGLLTSQIFQGRTVVSSVTPTCGVWVGKNESTESVNYGIAAELLLNATLEAEDYVKNCYTRERSTSTILDCGKLHTQTIPVAVQHNATCPFPTGICRYNDQSAYAMDTGKLPFTTLGLNCKRCHELAVRRRTVCAPLREGRLFMGMVGDDAPEGEGTRWVWSFYKNATGGNETYSEEINWTQPGFKLRSMNLAAVGNTSLLQPPLRHPDGYHNPVLVLITVNFGVGFLHKANDPIFSIQGDIEPERLRKPDWPWKYRSNQVLGILGCDELMQYCSLKTGRCTDLKGVIGRRSSEEMDAEYSILAGNTTKDDDAYTGTVVAAVLVDNLLQQSTLQASIFDRDGNAALQAARSLQNDRISAPLPPEQWKIEVDHWFRLAMARLQLGAFATIERRPGVDPARVRNLWKGQRVQDSLCGHIKFNSPGHTSLSFFGVLFVVVGCALILLASFFEVVRETVLRRWLGARMVRWSAAENLALLEEKAG